MIRRVETFLREVVLLFDGATLGAAFLATYFFRRHFHHFYRADLFPGTTVVKEIGSFWSYVPLLLAAVPIWACILHALGGYRDLRLRTWGRTVWIIVKASLLTLCLMGTLIFILGLKYVSRTFVVFFIVGSALFLMIERGGLIGYWEVLSRRRYFQRGILLVGTGPRAQELIRTIHHQPRWGLRIIGILDLDPRKKGETVSGVRVLGALDELPTILRRRVVDEVIFVVPRGSIEKMEEAVRCCESVGVRATIAVDLFNVRFARSYVSEWGGVPVVSFETTPSDAWQLAVKRQLDIVVSGAGLILLSPVFLLTVVLIKLTSAGPVFFGQNRYGLNGRQFTVHKFRSMVADAEKRKGELEHLNEMTGPVFKIANDPRLTPLGRWLRRTSIDELPQLYNVLKGEMSLVGPRPLPSYEVEKFHLWQRRRMSMRPGITGFWQVSGRNKVKDFNQWVQMDLDYIDRWSLKLDFQLLLRTIPAVLFARGAR